ncbi:MAG: hypothetical protein ACTSPP_01440 [Candidatus Heimdallarchaeaceae archaeon]
MKEFRVHLFRYLSVLEIFWDNHLREKLSFLRNNDKINSQFLSLLFSRDRETEEKKTIFIHNYGNLRWNINNDNMIYLRTMKYLFQENQPFRPFVPLSTPTKKSKNLKRIAGLYNSGSSISLYPQLVFEIRESFSVGLNNADKLKMIITDAKRAFFNKERKITNDILKSVFGEIKTISERMSDVFILIESTIDTFDKTEMLEDISKAIRLSRMWIKKIEQNKWMIIYGNPNPHIKQRLRVRKVFQVYNLLSILNNWANFFLSDRIDEQMNFLEKIKFIEFILTTLNLNYYSSAESRTYYFPRSYQRLMFNTMINETRKEGSFKETLCKVKSIFYDWDSYLQIALIKKRNIPINQFKTTISFKKEKGYSANIGDKAKLMLSFFIYLYKNEEETELSYQQYKKNNRVKGYSLNYIRENFIPWVSEKESKCKFTVRELREKKPEVLVELEEENLIIVTETPETRVSRLYSLNIDHPYIKEKI